jgi:serine/threonine protein kinase
MSNKTIRKFELLKTLGQGGYGRVYLVRDTILNVERALKVLHPALMADPNFIERFKREAQILARLEHPHIIPVHEMDQIGEHIYISMSYVAGGSLKELLDKKGHLPFELAFKITQQIASALEYAYNQPENLIHRDIKPSNILFERDGTVRLSDFGFAKALSGADSISLTTSGGMIGTYNYMAPEIWRGKSATSATDVYSLACVLYEMLTGEMLFSGESPPEIMKKHFIDGPQFTKQWKEGIPEEIESVLEKALVKNSEERYQSAGEFFEALEGLQEVKDEEREKAAFLKEAKLIKTAERKQGEDIILEGAQIKGQQKKKEPSDDVRKENKFVRPSIKEDQSKINPKGTRRGVKDDKKEIARIWQIGGISAALMLTVVCFGIMFWILYKTLNPTTDPVGNFATSTPIEVVSLIEESTSENESGAILLATTTTASTATLTTQATQTELPTALTADVSQTPTIDPYPTLTLPFQDNFDSGLHPEWRLQGNESPVLVDGRLTAVKDGKVTLEIGNGNLRDYTLEFDLISTSSQNTSIIFFFTPNICLTLNDGYYRGKLYWNEFYQNEWREISSQDTSIFNSEKTERIRIVRSGDLYQIYKDGVVENTMKYGDPSGASLKIQINENYIFIDNLIIQ